MKYPACIYGKPDSQEGLGSSSYAILHSHDDFSGEALTIFNSVKKSFNWRSAGPEPFPPCYAYWPLKADSGLSFRFLDMGRDKFGRPHTLRLEAALVTGESWNSTRTFIGPTSWPKSPCSGDLVDLSSTDELQRFNHPPEKPIFLVEPHKGECLLFASSNFPFVSKGHLK